MRAYSPAYQAGFLSRLRTKIGIGLGLATAPFVASGLAEQDPNKPTQDAPYVQPISEKDFSYLQNLRAGTGMTKVEQERKYEAFVDPIIKPRVIRLYEQMNKENELIHAGKMKAKDRKVKPFIASFTPRGERAPDQGADSMLHVTWLFKDRQQDGKELFTLVNEHWHYDWYTGGLNPTEYIRARVQVKEGSLSKPGPKDIDPNDLFITANRQVAWEELEYPAEADWYPILYGQYSYNEKNKRNLTKERVRNMGCADCHNQYQTISRDFLKPWQQKTNYALIVPEVAYDLPVEKQPGYVQLEKYAMDRVKKGEVKRGFTLSLLKDLRSSSNLVNPNIVRSLKTEKTFWVGSDTPLMNVNQFPISNVYWRSVDGAKKQYRKAGHNYLLDQGRLQWTELWDHSIQFLPHHIRMKSSN